MAVVKAQFDTDQRKPWYFKALRPDGSPLTFGYEVESEQGENIGLVGQGSMLFIRTNDVPAKIKVAIDKQQGRYYTISFNQEIDVSKTYSCQ